MCGKLQTNKHVLSNCSSNGALCRYTSRHNKILYLLTNWLSSKLTCTELYCDLPNSSHRQVSDLFVNSRPDIALKKNSNISILELTVCHETNFLSSRKYKLDKYKNIASDRSQFSLNCSVAVYTCEVSTLGFVTIDPKLLSDLNLPPIDYKLMYDLSSTAIKSSFEIYIARNT